MIKQQHPAIREHVTRRGTVTYSIDNDKFASGIWGPRALHPDETP